MTHVEAPRDPAPRYTFEEPGVQVARRRADSAPDESAPPAGPVFARVERLGPSYAVTVRPLGAVFVFRDVRTAGELAADIRVGLGDRHLFRTTTTMTLTGRATIAKVAAEMARSGDLDAWRRATFAAVEAVLAAEEQLGAPVDLRSAPITLPAGGLHLVRPFWPSGSMMIVAPGDMGKSTIMRAVAVSLASGRTVIPGIEPVGQPRPVLYVAGEDPTAYWHSRSIEAICRGLELDRRSLAEPIELFDARGRSLPRIARAIAERASSFGAIVLDSHQSLLPSLGGAGDVRDRDTAFWAAVDQMERSVAIAAHPNRADARGWDKADGRIAGSEVNRDRVRMAWRGTFEDQKAVAGTSYRRYTLANVKNTHGPKEPPLSFAASWVFGQGEDTGIVRFMPADPVEDDQPASKELPPALAETLRHYRAGATTPAALRELMPELSDDAARQRLRRVRVHLGEEQDEA